MYNKILLFYFLITLVTVHAIPRGNDDREKFPSVRQLLVRRDEREQLVSTEYGDISSVEIGEVAPGQHYHLQFITLEPNALFLPALLHADMVFYVQSGEGRLSWADEDKMKHVKLRRGDLYTLRPGTIFHVHSNLEDERQKLRLYAVFINPNDNQHERSMGAYSSIGDIVLGFDKQVLQAAFQVPKEMIEELTSGAKQPAIVHAPTTEKKEKSLIEIDSDFMDVFLGRKVYNSIFDTNKKKSKTKAFNLYDQKPDVKNRHGQSLIVNRKDLHALKGPDLSIFMVNLTADSMMGPHWNPVASEVSMVLQGEGMVRIVGPSISNKSDNSQSTRFKVREGDVFVVPRFHPMAQMAFTNDSFVFMGFSSTTKKNHPQFLSGKASVLRILNKEIVAASFGVTNTSTIERFLEQQGDSVILGCESCAEEEFRILEEEIERKREEERRRREEEERKREEEEEKKKQEEEEARRREEAARKRREEEAREEEERAKKEEERQWREEEEARERKEEKERRRKQEEERQEEEERARRQEEAKRREEEAREKREEAARWEEEEARRQEEMREEEAKKQEEEERARREKEGKEEEEEYARKEEERQEEEERVRREEEKEEAREKREEAARREEVESRRQEEMREEEAKRQEVEEEAKRREEEAQEEEESRRSQEEEEERRRERQGEEEEGERGEEETEARENES